MHQHDGGTFDIAAAVHEILRNGCREDGQSNWEKREQQMLWAYRMDVSERCQKYLESLQWKPEANAGEAGNDGLYPGSFLDSVLGTECRSILQGGDSSRFLRQIAVLLSDCSSSTAATQTRSDVWNQRFKAIHREQAALRPGVPVLVEAETLTGTVMNLLLQSMDRESFQGMLFSRSASLAPLYGMDLQFLRRILTHRKDIVFLISDIDKIHEPYREQFCIRLSSFLQKSPWRVLISCQQVNIPRLSGFKVYTQHP